MTKHADQPVILWRVSYYRGHYFLRDMRVWETPEGFRLMGPCGDVAVCIIDGDPRYPWRRTRPEAVSAHVEQLDADLKSLADREREIRAEKTAMLQLGQLVEG